LAASTVLSQVWVKLAPVEVDDHRPAPSVLVGLKPQHLAVFGQLGDDGRLLTRNRRVERPMTSGHHGWRIIPGRSLAWVDPAVGMPLWPEEKGHWRVRDGRDIGPRTRGLVTHR
jgi:hypothetical protein